VSAINIKTIQYEVELITESGGRYDLTPALITSDWEESINELAQRATITLQQKRIEGTWLHALAKINCIVRIKGEWGGGGQQLFDGTIWDWGYTSATNKELVIMAYDKAIRLMQSSDFYYYSAGMTTQALISDICGQWGIPVSYQWGQSLTHEKKAFRGKKTVADMIISLLEEVRDKTGEDYVIYFKDGQLKILEYGSNSPVYLLDRSGTISTTNKLTINNLVTKVKVYGRKEDAERGQVEGIVEGDMRFGTLQSIILRDSNKTVGEAMAEANALIASRGRPEEMIKWQGPALPFLRKGDKVEINAGNLIGFFYVEGVVHYGNTRRMSLTLRRAG
jgi:hypothetical protein